MSKWRDFLKREIIDGSYEEIIDTEDVYKKEKIEKINEIPAFSSNCLARN